jgi:hypothetical protein
MRKRLGGSDLQALTAAKQSRLTSSAALLRLARKVENH